MQIGGYVPSSLSDFPGRIAAVVFTQGCNWRCPWCHNPALVYPERFTPPLPETDVLARLAARRGQLDGVVVTGGEPTLQADLAGFLAQVKALGFATKLDTNGSRPEVVRALLAAGLVDCVAMDLKAPWSRYTAAVGMDVDTAVLEETIALLRSSGVEHQLRTTRWPGLTTEDERGIVALAAGSPHVWQEYRPA
jgi:pyruvate formate lyase activating enzyme